jgi:hypothetical protein
VRETEWESLYAVTQTEIKCRLTEPWPSQASLSCHLDTGRMHFQLYSNSNDHNGSWQQSSASLDQEAAVSLYCTEHWNWRGDGNALGQLWGGNECSVGDNIHDVVMVIHLNHFYPPTAQGYLSLSCSFQGEKMIVGYRSFCCFYQLVIG